MSTFFQGCFSLNKTVVFLQSAQNRLLIKNGKVVNADGIQDADVYVEEGVIKWVNRPCIQQIVIDFDVFCRL